MAKVESIEATLVVKTDNILGECPLWSGNEVLWVDIDGKKFWAYVLLTSTFVFLSHYQPFTDTARKPRKFELTYYPNDRVALR